MGLTSVEKPCSPVITNLRIILLGKTGSGKSATGNTILRREAFNEALSPSSVTKNCQIETSQVKDRSVTIIDTPGLFDTSMTEEEMKSELVKCIELSVPGPHIFLLVIRIGVRFTEEEKNAVKWIRENFGEEAFKYTALVFTRRDELQGRSIEDYVDRSPDLKKLISDCKAGYIVFNNRCKEDFTQVADLFEMIDDTVQSNEGHFTSNIYKEAQNRLWWRKCRTNVISASKYVAAVAAGAAVPAVGRAVLAERGGLATVGAVLRIAGRGIATTIARVFRP